MKKAFCLFLLFFVCRSARLLYAGTYTVDNLPMVYLQDKTKHVVNPDGSFPHKPYSKWTACYIGWKRRRAYSPW